MRIHGREPEAAVSSTEEPSKVAVGRPPIAEHLLAAGNRAVGRLIQAKSAVGPAADRFEREADRVAAGGSAAVGPVSGVSSGGSASVSPVSGGLAEVAGASSGGGQPLDADTRSVMESRFGADFSEVRVHTDSEAPAQINAVAYTSGTDIVFSPSAYDPGSAAGQRLLAHELTHVVQQSGGNVGHVQRQVADPGAADAEMLRIIAYQATVLRNVPPMAEADQSALAAVMDDMPVYQQLVERDGLRSELQQKQAFIVDLQGRNAALERGEELVAGVGASPEMMAGLAAEADAMAARIEALTAQIEPQLQALGTDEAGLRRRVEEEFPAIWKRQAVAVVNTMLDENEARVLEEQQRYADLVCSPDIDGLVAADAALQPQQRQIEELTAERNRAEEGLYLVTEWGAVPIGTDDDRAAIAAMSTRISELTAQLQADRNRHGAQHPILLSADYAPGVLQNLPDDQLQQLTGGWTAEILDNIADTRRNVAEGKLKVWDLNDVPALTWRSLGLQADGPLGQVLQRQYERERSDETTLQLAIAALAITAGIVATIATAGGAAVVAAAAAGFGVGIGLGQLAADVDRYQTEGAAGNVAMDPVLADISVNEPELLPIIMDVVATGMDLAAAVVFVRSMSAAERALAAEGRLVTISPQTRRLALSEPALLAEYERVANSKMPTVVADVLSAQRSTPNRARLLVLRRQFDQLRQSVGEAPLTQAQRQQANDILREARDLARSDFDNVRKAVWRRLRQDPDLVMIEQQMQQAGDAAQGGRALQVSTEAANGSMIDEPLGLEHRTRLSDNPWAYNDPTNLIVTDASQNEQFLEALRQHGFVWPTDDIEAFVVRNGLNDQALDFAPQAR